MGVKRYVASIDSTITDAYKENLTTRASGSNMGLSDVLEVFSIYGQATTSSVERARILAQFPVSTINSDRTSGDIPSSGSVSYYLKFKNAEHALSTPRNFELVIQAVSQSWTEGNGLDMEGYTDLGAVNWVSASSGSLWNTAGGDYHISPVYTASFDTGVEDLEVNITNLVEEWLAGAKENYGVGIKLNAAYEGVSSSFYTKRFFARGSEFLSFRPHIEARWNASVKDDRGNFFASSSLMPAEDNLNTLYFYNRVRGRLTNIPAVGTGLIYLNIFSGSSSPTGSALTLHNGTTVVTGGYVTTGIYSASVAVNTTASILYDVWFNGLTGSSRVEYFTGSAISVRTNSGESDYEINKYVSNITNLKSTYSNEENARFRVYSRRKDWSPTVYTIARNTAETQPVDNGYYKIRRIQDGYDIIPYGTGSDNHTLMSYDRSGSYFDVDMSMLDVGYAYEIRLAYKLEGQYREQKERFKFRVED